VSAIDSVWRLLCHKSVLQLRLLFFVSLAERGGGTACESSTALWVLSRLWLRLCRGLIAFSLFCSGHGSPVFLSWRVCREDPSMSLRCPVFGVISA
ncbi:unnamed protein product, partial [Brassica rapa subsp. trilocularis]